MAGGWNAVGWRVKPIALGVALAVVLAGAVGFAVRQQNAESDAAVAYCAYLPDAIGLYVGNPVTQMGYPIGTVDAVTAQDYTQVRVDFTVRDGRRLPAEVKAVLRSTSILADRSLELAGNYESGAELATGDCVPLSRAATPKSISEVVGAASTFVEGITPADSNDLGAAIEGLDGLLSGHGGDINRLLTTSSALLDSPDQAIADIGVIVGNLARLSTAVNENSGPLKEVIQALPITTPYIAGTMQGTADLMDSLPNFIILVDDLERQLGAQTQEALDSLPGPIHASALRADELEAFLKPLPALLGLIGRSTATGTGIDVTYQPAAHRISNNDPQGICVVLNAVSAGSCTLVGGAPHVSDVALLQLALSGGLR